MNIAYVCREFGPVTGGGIGTYIYNACLAMVDRGHCVYLVTNCFNEDNIVLLPRGIELATLKNTRSNRIGSFITPHHEYSYRVYDTLRALVEEKSIDVAEFAEFGGEGFATIRAKRLLGEFTNTKLIVKLHTPSSLLYKINEDHRLHVDGLCDYAMEDYCVEHADMVTSPSLSLRQYFEKRVGRNDIQQCPYPLELPEKGSPRTFTDEQIRRVRLIGSIQVRKGVDTFIKAAIQVLEHDPTFLFEIWGADRNSRLFGKTYVDIVGTLIPDHFKNRIIFAGEVPYTKIPQLFQESCFCVYPSRWENWANVCLEAMSYGCVVLASREGGMSEMVEHNRSGFVIDPLDPNDIASLILNNCNRPELLAEISRCAHERSNEICDPEKAASGIEQNYIKSYGNRKWRTVGSDAPLVSVVIPYYNQPQYVVESVESVKQADYPHCEIIVVNDGSTTQSANDVFDSLSGVKKVNKENGGLSSARNAGIAVAEGDFLLPLDADDLVDRDYIRKGVEALMNNPALGYVSCHAQNFGEINNAYIPLGFVPELMPYLNTHGKCTNLYRKELFSKYGGYDEVMTSYEDWDLLLTLNDKGVKGDVLPDEMFHYRRHFDSMVYVTANRQRADLIQYMMIKHEDALGPYSAKMAIMLARLWKEAEMRHEFAQQQIANAHFQPSQIGQLQLSNESRMQVYSQVNGEWWEHNSVYVDYVHRQWHVLKLNLPFEGHDGKIRVDPANTPGTIVIKELSLSRKDNGKVQLHANARNNFQGCSFSIQGESWVRDGFLIMRSIDDDPQILFPDFSLMKSLYLTIELYFTSDSDAEINPILKDCQKSNFTMKFKNLALQMLGFKQPIL